ncbi:non-homologous end joining protein Ku [Streptomyces poriferorum]|uniref:Non-homologous end joining protein Ku n=1 Tax=Streptomyces poriferorum TaxID=2798799 RepID=A0ABY9INF0_9ACTN|nr:MULTISPECIES: Ku protein [unclassified Streptomyces]MDP5314741.1 Ku protein [Streptomyces sp. Alt4]WLQ56364.1 Ku protein [Streptomyces sp. Alt2]
MRSIWNGAISFGLVSIPIKLVNATENHSISFRQIHAADGGRIRYRKVCELDGEEVTASDIGKAYEDADGSMIPITDEDLGSLPLPTAKTIEIVAFVPADSIDPLQMDAAYYLSANGVPAAKPYTLLREALKRSQKVALAKYALRGRERLGMLRVVDDVIAMHGLLWPDEIRAPEGVAPESDVSVRDAELDLADALMDTLGEVDMDSLHDDYREAVEELIAAKASGETLEQPETGGAGGGKVIDLLAALESSVRAAKEARGEDGGEGSGAKEEKASVTSLADRKPSASTTHRTPTGKSVSRSSSSSSSGSRKSASSPKSSGAKKSTASSGRPAAKKSASSSGSGAKKTASKAGASKSGTSKSTTSKSTTSKKTAAKKQSGTKTATRKRASA